MEKPAIICGSTLPQYLTAFFWHPLVHKHFPRTHYHPVLQTSPIPALEQLTGLGVVSCNPWKDFWSEICGITRESHTFYDRVNAAVESAGAEGLDPSFVAQRLYRFALRLKSNSTKSATEPISEIWEESGIQSPPELDETQGLIAAHNDQFVWVGALIAYLKSQRFLVFQDWSDFSRELDGRQISTLTVIAEPAWLSQKQLGAIIGFAGNGAENFPLGVLTAKSLESLTFVVLKSQLYPQIRFGNSITVVDQDQFCGRYLNHQVLSYDDLKANQIESLASEPLEFLGLSMHGDNIDANLNEAVLCGKVSTLPARSNGFGFPTPTHTCLTDDLCRRNIHGKSIRLPIDRLRCKVFFAETCSGVGMSGGIFPAELSLALGAMDGWIGAYISSTKIIRTTQLGSLLMSALLNAGYSLGQTTLIMSAFHRTTTEDVPSYLLLGDPDVCLTNEVSINHVKLECSAAAESTDVEVVDIQDRLVRIDLIGPGAEDLAHCENLSLSITHLEMHQESAPGVAVLVLGLPEAPVSLFIFSPGEMKLSYLSLRVSAIDDWQPVGKELTRYGRNLTFLTYLHRKISNVDGLRDTPELRKQAKDLRAVLDLAEEAFDSARLLSSSLNPRIAALTPTNPQQILVHDFIHKTQDADRQLAENWPSWQMPHHFVPFYNGYLVSKGKESSNGPCYLCGTPSFKLSMISHLRPEIGRTLSHCPRCGVLSDKPEGEEMVMLLGPDRCCAGDTVEQTLAVKNNSDLPKTFSACLSFEGEFPWFGYTVHDNPCTWTVAKRSEGAASFELSIEPTSKPGVYYLIAFVVSSLAISISTKPFAVMAQ